MQNTSQIQQDSLKFLKINYAQVLLLCTGEEAGGKTTESKSNSSFVQNK